MPITAPSFSYMSDAAAGVRSFGLTALIIQCYYETSLNIRYMYNNTRTHHTDLTFFYKMFQVEHWLSLDSH